MLDLQIFVPTRGRPADCHRLMEAVNRTRHAQTRITFLTDDDDDTRHELAVFHTRAAPRDKLSARMNAAALDCIMTGTAMVVGTLSDDALPRTPGWDAMLLEQLRTPGIAWPESLRRPGAPEFCVISGEIIGALGWMYLPAANWYFADMVWLQLANGAGCGRYVHDAIVEHLHPDRTGAARDDAIRSIEAQGPADKIAYEKWWREQLPADVEKVKGAVQTMTQLLQKG